MLGKATAELPIPDAAAAERMARDDERPCARGSITVEEIIPDRDGGARIFETRKFVVERGGQGTGARRHRVRRHRAEARRGGAAQPSSASCCTPQKLESLGVLAGGIAHDFNNLLMAILGNADLALAKSSPESPVRPYLQSIDKAAQRAADLTNQMLAYSGKGRFVVEPINLSRLVEEMGHLLETVVSKRAALRYRLAAGTARRSRPTPPRSARW